MPRSRHKNNKTEEQRKCKMFNLLERLYLIFLFMNEKNQPQTAADIICSLYVESFVWV